MLARSRGVLLTLWVTLGGVSGCLESFPASPPEAPRQTAATKRGNGSSRSSSKQPKPKTDTHQRPRAATEQTYREAWRLICDAEHASGAERSDVRAERGAIVATWLVHHLRNRRARRWFVAWGRLERAVRRFAFEAEIKRLGLKQCAVTSLLFEPSRDGGTADALETGLTAADAGRAR